MISSLLRSTVAKVLVLLYIALVIFWLWIRFHGLTEGFINNLYGALYPLISLIGGIYGIFVVSKKWGGTKSVIGRGIFFLSLGLLAEVFGQWAWSYYALIQGIEVPYPSIADIGYLAIIPFYSYAMYNFAKASGAKLGLRTFRGRIQAILIPVAMIAIAFFFFLRNVPLDLSQPIATALNFAYPGLEPIAVCIGILTYGLSREFLGGLMRPKILLVIFALVFQFITDYTFLYQANVGTYYNAGIVDLLYTTSFLIMSVAVLSFMSIAEGRSSLATP
jgi:hypothetical protein